MKSVGVSEVTSFIKQKLYEWGILTPPHTVTDTLEDLCDTLDDDILSDDLFDDDLLIDELLEDDELILFDLDFEEECDLLSDFDDILDEHFDDVFEDYFEDDLMGTDQTLDNLEDIIEMGGDEPVTQPQSKVDLIRQMSGNHAFKIEHMDITTIETGVIAHGVNCQLAMGSGVAAALFNKWPLVRSQYMLRSQGKGMLGTADAVEVDADNNITVYNCYTQEYFGPGDRRYANSASIMVSLLEVANECQYQAYPRPMYVPLIGCDLGGLDYKKDFLPVLEQLMIIHPTLDLTLCVYP
jgi:O-acetyl-ADP-ribose deacetylase (regulator of RNase III)